MSAAAAKASKIKDLKKILPSSKNLWIDPSLLPNARQITHFKLPNELMSYNRFLELAEIALGNPKGLPAMDSRKKKQPLKGKERRSTR
jgi:hypothetical protein